MIRRILISLSMLLPLSAEQVPVYLGSGSAEGISRVVLDSETGELWGLKNVVITSSPGSLTISGDKKYLFAVGRVKGGNADFVASFVRQADDSLQKINQQSSMGAGPCYLSLDHDSKYLFVANYSGGSVASYKVNAKGEISPAVSHHQHNGSSVHPKRQTKAYAHSVVPSPDNKFVYVADLGTDRVVIYKLDATTGGLIKSGDASVPAGSGARHMVFSKNGKKLYVLNELTLTISRFSRDTMTGALKLEVTKPVMANLDKIGEKMTCSEVALSADGKFLYTAIRDLANKRRDIISVLNATDLNIVQEQATGVWIPRHFNISPSGKWLVIAGMRENKVVVLARDVKTGKLKPTKHSVELKRPMWILFP